MALSESLRGHLDTVLLAGLREGPLHGYALARRVAARSGGVFELGEGALYAALHRLERAGLVSSRWEREAGRKRRVYELTRAGAATLDERRREWAALAGGMQAMLEPGSA